MIVKEVNEIGLGFSQSFKYTPLNFGSVITSRIVEMIKAGTIDKDIGKVALYLYKFKCAPMDYILRDCNLEDNRKTIRKMDELVRNRIFNEFVLTDNQEEFTNDGLVFYTLDYGAILLFRLYEDKLRLKGIEDENLESWKATDLFMPGTKVKRALMTIDLCASMPNAERFDTYVLYRSYGTKIRTYATVKQDEEIYLAEMLTDGDVIEEGEAKMTEKLLRYEQLLGTDGWTYYFDKEPTLLIVAASEKIKKTIEKRLEGCQIPKIQYEVLYTEE